MCRFISNRIVTTRKDHNCFGCTHRFPKRTIMNVNTSVGDDGPYSLYFCIPCWDFYKSLTKEDLEDDIEYGDLKEFEGFKQIEHESR